MSDLQIETLERTIENAGETVKLMERMDKLRKNKDFKAIIEDELLNKYALNTLFLLSDPSMNTKEQQEDLIKEMEMVGRFNHFINSIYQRGRQAEKTIIDSGYVIEELRAEGGFE